MKHYDYGNKMSSFNQFQRFEGNSPLQILSRRGDDNIKMDIKRIRSEGVDWHHLAEDRDRCRAVVKTVMNLRFQ